MCNSILCFVIPSSPVINLVDDKVNGEIVAFVPTFKVPGREDFLPNNCLAHMCEYLARDTLWSLSVVSKQTCSFVDSFVISLHHMCTIEINEDNDWDYSV